VEVHETQVDGVPAVWSDVPGPLRVGLLFRVGQADERLVEHGVTHLVEHAAIRAAGQKHGLGGAVDLLKTHFEVWGGEDRVVAGLAALCAALGDLPRDGLDVERRVLAAEAAASGGAVADLLLYERCGARGIGVAALDELGLRALDDDAVLDWVARWFVRGNAVLGLALPAVAEGPPGGVAVGALAKSAPDDHLLAGLLATGLERCAYDTLRARLGGSYDVEGRVARVSSDARHIVLAADCQDEHATGACRGLLDAWRDVADGVGIAEGREDLLRMGRDALVEPEGRRAVLARSAGRLLEGQAVVAPTEMVERVNAVALDDVAALAAALSDELIALAPAGAGPGVELPELARSPGAPVTGRRFKQRRAPHHVDGPRAVVIADEGVTAESDTDAATIRFRDAVAAIERFGGGLDVVSADGLVVTVDSSNLRDGDTAVRAIRDVLPADVVVPLDPRAVRLSSAVAEQFGRSWVVAPALEHVWPLLAWDEELLVLAEASRGLRAGVLAVTDRRVVLVMKVLGEQVHNWPRSAIRKASRRDIGPAARLRLHLVDGEHVTL